MIRGRVDTDQQRLFVPLWIQDGDGRLHSVDAMIDTGFTASLALPVSLAKQLRLQPGEDAELQLADDSFVMVPIYHAMIDWDDDMMTVTAYTLGSRPIIGMELLARHRVHFDAVEDGEVLIERLP